MRDSSSPPPAVVVGIDGSRAAIGAALWAIDEALSRDIPLRLVYAIDPRDDGAADHQDAARQLATAEIAVRQAFIALESTEKPVKIEVEILQGRPTPALLRASRSAAMICVGSLGLRHFAPDRVGSTATALAESANCPVAIIRGHDARPTKPGWIVLEVNESPANSRLLERGFEEARLRGAPLRVVTTWASRLTDIHDGMSVADGNRLAKAQLDSRLAQWKKRYPELDVEAVAVHGSTRTYLEPNAGSIQLVVVGHHRPHGLADPVDAPAHTALHNTDCSVLVGDDQNRL